MGKNKTYKFSYEQIESIKAARKENKRKYPHEVVKSRLLKMDYMTLIHVLGRLSKIRKRVSMKAKLAEKKAASAGRCP